MSKIKSAPEIADQNSAELDAEEINLEDNNEATLSNELVDDLERVESRPTEETAEPSLDTAKEVSEIPSNDTNVSNLDDKETDEAINEIVAEEADTVLDAEDRARDDFNDEVIPVEPQKQDGRIKAFFKSIWKNPKSRWAIISSFVIIVLALALIPNTRYFLLNTARVRASVELKVIDSNTLQPLKNVTVKVSNVEVKTDNEGVAKLENVLLGKSKLKIEKRAFEEQEKDIIVGWGSNPLGEFNVKAVGSQYTFFIKDYLSGKAVSKAEVTSGDGNAISDDDGKAVLVLDTAELDDSTQVEVNIIADGYRVETQKMAVNNKESQSAEMVPSKKHTFVSKRSGSYDLYTIDVDGKNETKIMTGSGFEREDMALITHPSNDSVAYVATRENVRNQSGYLLSTLYVVNTSNGESVKIDQSEQIQVIGWSDEGRLVYVKIAAGASGSDPKRHRLISFNTNQDDLSDSKELASSNSFNDVIMANNIIYYAPSNIFQEESAPGVYSIKPDGNEQKAILDKEAFSIVRTDYDTLYLSSNDQWYSYTIGSPLATSSSPPGTEDSRIYVDNIYNKFSLWLDERDGKGVLLSLDKTNNKEQTLTDRGGLKHPIYWLNDKSIVFRVADGRETADYVLSTEGGEPQKISNVTDSSGISRWYYF